MTVVINLPTRRNPQGTWQTNGCIYTDVSMSINDLTTPVGLEPAHAVSHIGRLVGLFRAEVHESSLPFARVRAASLHARV